jgi:hypothetical protein
MKDIKKYPEVVINIPMKFKYYLDSLFIVLGAVLVSGVIIYVGTQIK